MYDAIKTTPVQAHLGFRLLTLASIKKNFQADINKSKKYVISGLEKDT